MKKTSVIICFLFIISFFFCITNLKAQNSEVTIYTAPEGITSSPDYTVSANGQDMFVYNPKVKTGREHQQKNMGVCYFDCIDSATITVHANIPMANVVIRPKTYGIKPVIKGQDITFIIHKSQKVTIEPDGHQYNALVIFANSPDVNPPKQSDPNVIYFGPGLHTSGQIDIKSNQTIYLAGGAVVRGCISGTGVRNVKILGHGIIDQSLDNEGRGFINLKNCSNIIIDGPILFDCRGWCNHLTNCKNVTISDMKEICWRGNTDGIDIDGGSKYLIENCYIRNWDDCIVIKSKGPRGNKVLIQSSLLCPRVQNVIVRDCILWSDLANALEIGYELETDLIDKVLFKDIDIIHAFGNNAISIHNSAQAVVRNIRYENIRIEDMNPLYCNTDAWPNNGRTPGTHVFEIEIGKSQWSKMGGQGTIRNIYFKNISATIKSGAQFPFSDIRGFDTNHTIEGVIFENLTIDGKKVMNATDARMNANSYVRNVTFH